MISENTLNLTLSDLFGNIEFTAEPKGLYDPLRYMISIGGKRLRPKLCLLACSLFSDRMDESILEPACALEVFHTFTLIHDDIMDRSPMRRGEPTVWKKWNSDTAILSGDVMCIESYRRIAKAPKECLAEVMDLFSRTAAQVCEGQQYDMDFESMAKVPMEDYMRMIGLKTAVLIACSAKVGAIIGGASQADADALYSYGYDLGLAFQVADDYLDTYGDQKVFGKPIGGDIVNNKKSWLLTRAMEDEEICAELEQLMQMPVSTEQERAAKIAAVREVYGKKGIDRMAREEVARLTDKAMASAESLSVKGVRIEALKRFAESLVSRAK